MSATTAAKPHDNGKEVVFKNCAPFTDCIGQINNTEIDNAKDIYIILLMYNLIEYRNSFSKTSGSLWQNYRDKPALTDAGAIANFHVANKSASFKVKQKITDKTADGGTKDVKIMVPLTFLSSFWRAKLHKRKNIRNNSYKALCSSCNFINPR